MQLQRQARRLPSVCGIPDDTDVGLRLQQNAQAVAHHGVIIRQNNRRHGASSLKVTMTRVPRPGADSTLTSAPSAAARSRMIISPQPWSFAGC
jgi:hypothetical protein